MTTEPHEPHDHEPADPPWLTEAVNAADDSWNDAGWFAADHMVRAALPILRAGIEAELLRDACGCGMPGAGILHPASDHRGQS